MAHTSFCRPGRFGAALGRVARALLLAPLLGLAPPVGAGEPPTEPLLRLETGMHTAPIRRIATDAAGRWAVTGSDDKTARVWEVATGRQVAVLRPPQGPGSEGKLFAVAMSPDARVVAAGGWTGWDWTQKNSIYLFDRASARLLRRLPDLPNGINHLAYSPDGRWLVACLGGKHGLRLFDAASGLERGRDSNFGNETYSAHFSPDNRRLVSTSLDGQVRLHAVDEQGRLTLLKSARTAGGTRPFSARYSPDGRRIAVGFDENRTVLVLDAQTLGEVAPRLSADTGTGSLYSVAWSADGRSLLAGGSWDLGGRNAVRRWIVDDWSRFEDVPLSRDSVQQLVALPAAAGGGWLYAVSDPGWGVLDANVQVLRRVDTPIADLRAPGELQVGGPTGRMVRYPYVWPGQEVRMFDPAGRTLVTEADAAAQRITLRPPRTEELANLKVTDWEGDSAPKLNGKRLALESGEYARSLAIAPDGRRFVLGADWNLRLFDASGKALWTRAGLPGIAWAVNVTADGRFAVAAYGDGTIRWHQMADGGREVLAFFPHADRKRWVAWTPEGYFDASPGADELIGYHLNRGQDREGEFVSARQLWETYYQPGLIARRLDADGDKLLAEQVARRGDIRSVLTAGSVPELELQSPAQAQTDGSYPLAVRIRSAGQGTAKLVVRVDGGAELAGRWNSPMLSPGNVVTMPVDLPGGAHTVTVELVDGRGVASKTVSAKVDVRRAVAAGGPTLHVLAVGVTNYRDQSLARGVAFAADDARAVGAAFERGAGGLYGKVRTRVLPNEQGTRDGIEAAGRELAATVQPDDTVVVYLAGHGITAGGDYHFVPWETRYSNFDALVSQSLSADRLRQMLASIVARKVLVLLDTCSAGRFSLVKGREIDDKASIDRFQRVTGRAMIAATADEKMALEGEEKHGVFTYALLRALDGAADKNNDRFISVTEIAEYIDEQVPAITKRKWGYEQFPMMETRGSAFPLVRRPQ